VPISDREFWLDVLDRSGRQAVQVLLPFLALLATGSVTGLHPLTVADLVVVAALVVVAKAVVGATVPADGPWWAQAGERAASAGAASALGYLSAGGFSMLRADWTTIGISVAGSIAVAVAMMVTSPPARVA
jgi:hypothetical protein